MKNYIVLIVLVAIIGHMLLNKYLDNGREMRAKYKYEISHPLGGPWFCTVAPEPIGQNCLRFQHLDKMLVVVCGDSLTEAL